MSEHAVSLAEFDISPTLGFLSQSAPSSKLPKPYDAWEEIITDLPKLIKDGELVHRIDSLQLADTSRLESEVHWRRAYVILGFITHAYVWGQEKPVHKIPVALSEPFLQVCAHLGMQPVLSYAGLCLWNWQTKEKQIEDCDITDLKTFASFTGTSDEANFYLIAVIVERDGGRLVAALLAAIAAAEAGQWQTVMSALGECKTAFRRMITAFDTFYPHCDPQVFFHQIRPFLAGLEVHFQKADGSEVSVKTLGGSAAQSMLFMSVDKLLGVEHKSTLFQELRAYTPGNHRALLASLGERPSIADLIEAKSAPPALHSEFASCLKALQDWRSKHIEVVSRYIVLPSRSATARKGDGATVLVGTGGSPLVQFLKQSRNETSISVQGASGHLERSPETQIQTPLPSVLFAVN